jgi:hypothetical protein
VNSWIAGLRRAPLRRFQTRSGAPSVSPPAVLPLVGLSALQSVDMRPARGAAIGSPLPPCPRRFRRSLWFLPSAVPRLVAQSSSSSRELYSPSECYRLVPAQRLPASGSFLGVSVPSSRHQPSASFAQQGFHPLPPCRPWRFSRLRRFSPPLALWVYFTPLPRPGYPFRGLNPPTQPSPARR